MKFKIWLENQFEDIRFYLRDKEQYGFLSNFYPSPFIIDNVRYSTVEHYYVSMKSDDLNYKQKIINSETPGRAKRLGDDNHKKSFFVNNLYKKKENWEEIKFEIMEKALYAKFSQNLTLKNALKATSPKLLLEDSPTDLIWGTGVIDNNGNYYGNNMLGKLLMKIRSLL